MRSSLNKKLLIPSLLAIAIGLATALAVYHFHARQVIQQELTKRLQREVQLTVQLMDDWLLARKNDIAFWASQKVLEEALTESGYYGRSAITGAHQLLASINEGYSFYESIFLANLAGDIVTHSTMTKGSPIIRLEDRPYVQATLHGESVVSSVVTSRITNQQVFAITAPIVVKGTIVGMLAGVVDFSSFTQLFLSSFKLKQNGYAFLSDAGRHVLASSKHKGQELASLQLTQLPSDRFPETAASGVINQDIDGHEFLTVYQHLPHTEWTLHLRQSLDTTFLPLQQIAQVGTIVAFIILTMVIVGITMLFQHIIIDRLQAILHIIRDVKAGNFTKRLPEKSESPDEITELTYTINSMIDQLDVTLASLNNEIQARKNTELKLAEHQANLETIIAKRSAELEKEVVERRRAEERLQRAEKYELLGTLAGGVAHDLNNILSGIVSYPHLLLLQLPQDSPLYRPLQTIKESGEKAAAVVDDLLTLTRRGVAVKEPVNLNELIVSYLSSPEFKKLSTYHPEIRIVAETSKGLPNLLGSSIHLTKTLMNLVSNAMESMEQGGIVRIRTENRYIDNSLRLYENIVQGEYVVLEVQDQGSGIKPEDIEKIFEPFYTKKKMGRSGTGLGMSVVWGTVKDHQGYIDCASTVGEGTTFTLFFPVTASIYKETAQAVQLDEYRGHGEKILIVDDVEEQRAIVSSILTELGYQVRALSSGEEAVLLNGQESFDLLVLDMILGSGMDGLDIYRHFLRLKPGQKAIITSGFSETERITEAIRLGVGQYVKKPYTIDILGIAIHNELSK